MVPLNEVCIKIYKEQKSSLIVVCDKDLINKTYYEGKFKLEVKKDFYCDTIGTVEEAIDLLDKAKLANLVGKRIINAAIENRLVDPQAVTYIDGIPHVQIMKLSV